jgi:chromosome segregation protein
MGLSEVTLTLVDPELSEAVAKVLAAPENHTVGAPFTVAEDSAPNDSAPDGGTLTMPSPVSSVANESAETDAPNEELAANESEPAGKGKPWKKRGAEKPAMHLKPGEVVVGRRLYRSGQSEYVINGRVARLRDVQELFMGMGLGPDSYAIIEQGRIGQILNSKPMDRRAIIEEAAGITMYKTKRRLAEAKLEASKINLSRVNDILVEVEKQLASLKRQASKARRYAELREQMRGLLRIVLASKAEHLDIDAARLENLLRDMEAAEERDARSVHELEAEQERLNARTYELDAELRQTHNLLGQTSLDLDRAENRITFNREQLAQLASRSTRVTLEIEQAERQATDLAARMSAQRDAVAQLREQSGAVESSLREATEKVGLSTTEQERLEASIAELRALAGKLVEESARMQAESLQAEEAAARHTAAEAQRSEAARTMGIEWAALALRVKNEEDFYSNAERRAEELGAAARDAQARLVALRGAQQETAQQLKQTRESLAAERARHSSVEQILSERAYTADAVQKLFNAGGEAETQGFHAVGLLADYAEVQEQYEGAIEQFLRDELEYVVVESFDQARAGVALLRDEMGGRATFFVDSLSKLNIQKSEIDGSLPMAEGVIARLDRLVDFRDPLGPAAKHFLTRLRTAYLVDTGAAAETLAHENPHSYYLTLDGTCYHGRMVSGGRQGDAGPLALKRELRQHDAEAVRLDRVAQEQQEELTRIEMAIAGGEIEVAEANAKHVEAEKSFVGAMHTRDQARAEHRRVEQQLAAEQQEIAWLHQEAEAARNRVEQARNEHAEALRSRANAEADAAGAADRLADLRRDFQSLQEQVVAQREALATMTERFTSAKAAEQRLVEEMALAGERTIALHQQHGTLLQEKTNLEAACEQLALQVEDLRKEKVRAEELKASLEKEWDEARARAGRLDESLRGKRQSLDELRSERSQRQIEKARNDADRDYLRQTCVAELNAQPEELMAQESQLLIGEELIAAETNYNEMKARVDAMGPVNMMALEEFKECEEREIFMRRERDDLVQSIENTQLTITELDQVSRQKFEEAFNFINSQFAVAFQSLFGGGHGEMRLGEPDSSGEMGIDIVAQPPGKRLQNILLLSGGEKALTALALLIAVFRYQPSPFCILDEVDAPLDEANVGRFNKMLADMCGQTQFIVVTHNRKTMEMGSVLYGVTMQEPGVSKLVSVKWEEAEQASTPKAASNAA